MRSCGYTLSCCVCASSWPGFVQAWRAYMQMAPSRNLHCTPVNSLRECTSVLVSVSVRTVLCHDFVAGQHFLSTGLRKLCFSATERHIATCTCCLCAIAQHRSQSSLTSASFQRCQKRQPTISRYHNSSSIALICHSSQYVTKAQTQQLQYSFVAQTHMGCSMHHPVRSLSFQGNMCPLRVVKLT